MELEVRHIFIKSLTTSASHQKLTLALYEILVKSNFTDFCKTILNNLYNILVTDYKILNNSVGKAIEFFIFFLLYLKLKCINEKNKECLLVNEVLKYLLENHDAANSIMRYRCCEVIGKLFGKFAEHSIINEDFKEVQDALLERATDPKADVRVQALIALDSFQVPEEYNNPVIAQYILSIYDISPKVRKVVVEKIAVKKNVIEHIVGRTRDIDVKVRLAAFTKLSKLVQYLKIVQRHAVLKAASLERNKNVKQFVTNRLVELWFAQYEYDCLKITKALRLDGDEKDVENTVKSVEFVFSCLFKTHSLSDVLNAIPIDDGACIPFQCLNWETVIVWRIVTQYLRSKSDIDEVLSTFLPDLVNFCEYIENYCKLKQKTTTDTDYLEQQFILQQLFSIALDYDVGDVVARKTLIQSTCVLLQTVDLSADVINIAMKVLEKCIPNVEARCNCVSEIIDKIMYPTLDTEQILKQDELVEMKNRYKIIQHEIREREKEEDYLKAAELQRELDNLKLLIKNEEEEINKDSDVKKTCDPDAIKKYLNIAAALLSSVQITSLNNTLISMKEQVIEECLIHTDNDIKAIALKCYVLCCIVDKASAKVGLHICAVPIIDYYQEKPCEVPLLTVAIGGVVDMLLVHGFGLLAEPDRDELSESMSEENRATFAGGTSLTLIIQGLVDLMDDDDIELSLKAVKGLCMLLIYSSIESPSVISRLILKWANPNTDTKEESAIKAMIGKTLQSLISDTNGSQQLQKAIIPTIRSLIRAPKDHPLHKVQGNVIKFLVALISTAVDSLNLQIQLAVSICDLMQREPRSPFNLAYSQALLFLDLSQADQSVHNDLLDDCSTILNDVENKNVINKIRKFKDKLHKISKSTQLQKEESENDETSCSEESDFDE